MGMNKGTGGGKGKGMGEEGMDGSTGTIRSIELKVGNAENARPEGQHKSEGIVKSEVHNKAE